MLKKSLQPKPFGIIAMIAAAVFVSSLAACGGGGSGVCRPGGSGASESNPRVICTAQDLADLAQQVNIGPELYGPYYRLGADIDLSGADWTPIGDSTGSRFRGHFDGGGKVISGLTINDPALDYAGLFGYIDGGSVKNLGVEIAGSGMVGGSYVGAIAGYVESGDISNCYSTGDVTGSAGVVGGIAGAVNESNIGNCRATGNVTGNDAVGGIAGAVNESNISNCYTTGDVSGNSSSIGIVGGIAGAVTSGNISNCYSTGDVSGSGAIAVGGITGMVQSGGISNCYVTGNVTRSGSADGIAGGIAGGVTSGNISNCYVAGDVTGGGSVGGITGALVNGGVSNCYVTGNASSSGGPIGFAGGIAGVLSLGSVSNCYATGMISGSNSVGGIAGYVDTSTIESCAALNPAIARISGSTGEDFGRVAGSINSSFLLINMALDEMTVIDSAWTTTYVTDDPSGVHGAGLAADDGPGGISNFITWTGWPFGENDATPWVWGANLNPNYPLPVLYWQKAVQIPAALPTHLN